MIKIKSHNRAYQPYITDLIHSTLERNASGNIQSNQTQDLSIARLLASQLQPQHGGLVNFLFYFLVNHRDKMKFMYPGDFASRYRLARTDFENNIVCSMDINYIKNEFLNRASNPKEVQDVKNYITNPNKEDVKVIYHKQMFVYIVETNTFVLNTYDATTSYTSLIKQEDYLILAYVKSFNDIPTSDKKMILSSNEFYLDTIGIDFEELLRKKEIKTFMEKVAKGYKSRMVKIVDDTERQIKSLEANLKSLYNKLRNNQIKLLYENENDAYQMIESFTNHLDINPQIKSWSIQSGNTIKIETKPMYITFFDEAFLDRAVKSGSFVKEPRTADMYQKVIDGEYQIGVGEYTIELSLGSDRSIVHNIKPRTQDVTNKHVSINCQGTFKSAFNKASQEFNLMAYLQTAFQFIQTATIADSAGSSTVKDWSYLVDYEGNLVHHIKGRTYDNEQQFIEQRRY